MAEDGTSCIRLTRAIGGDLRLAKNTIGTLLVRFKQTPADPESHYLSRIKIADGRVVELYDEEWEPLTE